MGVGSMHVCGCKAQQDWINMTDTNAVHVQPDKNQVQVVNGADARGLVIITFLPSSSAPLGSAFGKNLPTRNYWVPGNGNISNLKWGTLHGGGIRYWPQWIRAVRFPPTCFIFPPDTIFIQCPQDNKVAEPTEHDGTPWHETNTFSVSVSCFRLNSHFRSVARARKTNGPQPFDSWATIGSRIWQRGWTRSRWRVLVTHLIREKDKSWEM